jgi:glycosyltransferase involved in cell wall biosynthesis
MSAVSAPAHTRRICVVAERMSGPLDEGGRKYASLLASALDAHATVLGISVGGPPAQGNGLVHVRESRTFASAGLRRAVREFAPDAICYVPEASMTVAAAMRGRALSSAFPSARLALVALQPRVFSALGRGLLRLLRPDVVLTLSRKTADEAAKLGCRTAVLPPAVDLDRFRPVDAAMKRELRVKFGLDGEAFVVLHVGHAKHERGVEALAELGDAAQGVLVAARSEGEDAGLIQHLRSHGVTVIEDYVAEVRELYQAADCYAFPVFQPDASIDAPLSVFEAMACNLPVAAAPFGALPDLLTDGPGFRFVGTPGELQRAVEDRAWMEGCRTREMVARYSWENAASVLLRVIEEAS